MSLTIQRGSTVIADGSSSVLINGFPLPDSAREMAEVMRPRAAQVAVVDYGNNSASVQLAISREFSTEARAKDHALRAGQTALGQYTLVIIFNDGTDDHTWTLSDVNGLGAAWKSAKPAACSGVRAEMQYTITGGTWSYTGPLAATYGDGLAQNVGLDGGTIAPAWAVDGGAPADVTFPSSYDGATP